jgi:xylulose-5-phosphate/fructose-6-phosphate phosphoketolase
MPGEVIDRPNPQPLASRIPDRVNDLAIKLEKIKINDADMKALRSFVELVTSLLQVSCPNST